MGFILLLFGVLLLALAIAAFVPLPTLGIFAATLAISAFTLPAATGPIAVLDEGVRLLFYTGTFVGGFCNLYAHGAKALGCTAAPLALRVQGFVLLVGLATLYCVADRLLYQPYQFPQ